VGHVSEAQGRHQTPHPADPSRQLPTVIIVSTGSVHDVNILDQLVWEAGSFYIMDRGYLDFAGGIGFISAALSSSPGQAKFPFAPAVTPVRGQNPACVSTRPCVMTGLKARHIYPDPLRRIGYRDPLTGNPLSS